VVLPQSITQEAEGDSLRKRFGTEGLPEFRAHDDRVQLHESAGAHGPDRYVRRRVIYVMLLLLLAAAAGADYVYTQPELRKQILGE